MNRRQMITGGISATALMAGVVGWMVNRTNSGASQSLTMRDTPFEVTHSEAEWRRILTDTQYLILREEQTENRFASPLNDEKRAGIYHCAGCDLPVYDAAAKYDSGTGWPSFHTPLENAVGTKQDNTLFVARIEVHCRRCGGHLGHIFNDGPEPTGKRHCLNGFALNFRAA